MIIRVRPSRASPTFRCAWNTLGLKPSGVLMNTLPKLWKSDAYSHIDLMPRPFVHTWLLISRINVSVIIFDPTPNEGLNNWHVQIWRPLLLLVVSPAQVLVACLVQWKCKQLSIPIAWAQFCQCVPSHAPGNLMYCIQWTCETQQSPGPGGGDHRDILSWYPVELIASRSLTKFYHAQAGRLSLLLVDRAARRQVAFPLAWFAYETHKTRSLEMKRKHKTEDSPW